MKVTVLRRWLRPTLLALAAVVVTGMLLLFKVNWVAGILAPVVAAILTGWFLQRFPQLGRPVAVTVKLNDIDYVTVGDSQIPASGHTVRITVEATGPLTVLLDELRPVTVSRESPGGYLSPHLGIVEPRAFEVLLDNDPPALRPIPPGGGQPAGDFPFKVSASDPEVFDLTVLTETADVRWYFELDTVCLGRRRTTRIDLAGRPFRTIARPSRTPPGKEPTRVA